MGVSWRYLTSVSINNGDVTVSVSGGHDLSAVEAGWSFDLGTVRAEISSGTAADASGNSTLTLAVAWDGANVINQTAKVVPTSGALIKALNALNETNDYAIATHEAMEAIATEDTDVTLTDKTGEEHTFSSMPKNARLIEESISENTQKVNELLANKTADGDDTTEGALLTVGATVKQLDLTNSNIEYVPDADAVIDIDFTKNKAVINGGFGVDKIETTAIAAVTHTRDTAATGVAANLSLGTAGVNVPRLVYDPETGEAMGYQSEESRNNLILQSEDFSGYTLSNANTPTDSGIESPVGSNWWLVESTAANGSAQNHSATGLSDTDYNCYSGYLKKYGSDTVELVILTLGGTAISLDLNYTFSTDTIDIQSDETGTAIAGRVIQNDGSVRVWVAFQNNDTGNTLGRIYIKPSETQADTVYVTGLQVEQGRSPTSYVATTTSTFIRGADGMTLPIGDNLNPSSFSLYWEGSFPEGYTTRNHTNAAVLGLTDNSYRNGVVIEAAANLGHLRVHVKADNVHLVVSDYFLTNVNGAYKIILTYDEITDTIKVYSNGQLKLTVTGGIAGALDFSLLDTMEIAQGWAGFFFGPIFTKKVGLLNKALSGSEAIRKAL